MTAAARLHRTRRLAALAFWVERLVPACAPALIVLLAFVALASCGLAGLLPSPGRQALAMLTFATAAILGGRGLRRVAPPTAAEIDRRLDRSDPHRPLATLADRPVSPGAEAVWQAHRQRALARAERLRPAPPRLGGSVALLGAAGLAAVASLIAPHGPARLWQTIAPAATPAQAASPRLQAWIVPPRRTGLPPIFLRIGDPAPIAVPIGAELTVSVLGGSARPVLHYGATSSRLRRLDTASFQATLALGAPGTLVVAQAGRRLATWRLAVAADQPPAIRIMGPASTIEGQLELPWQASDDYGLASVTAELRLRDRPGAAAIEAAQPLASLPRSAAGARLPDLTAHPWAGLPVLVRYVAHDGAGQRAVSGEAPAVLPARSFQTPLARALIVVRRRLVIDPMDIEGAVRELDQLSRAAIGHLGTGAWLDLRAIAALLAARPDTLDETQARLWQLATAIEDGDVPDAKQQLDQARTALRDALGTPPGAAQQDRIEALSQALQQAMQRYLQAMERQSAAAGQSPPEQQNGRPIDPKQLEQMARDMADAARAGRLAEAEQRLRDLTAILDHLHPSGTLAQGGSAGPPPDPALQQLLQAQTALQGHADQRLSDTGDPRTSSLPERDPDEAAGQPDPATQQRTDAAAQKGLRERLGDLAARLGERAGSVPQGLAGADKAMRDAAEALAKGDDRTARQAQQRALDGLRAGQNQMAGDPQGKGPPQPGKTDPLGRPLAEGGITPDTSDTTLPQQEDAARARAVRDELRRRDADRTRPPAELNYIERLLKP